MDFRNQRILVFGDSLSSVGGGAGSEAHELPIRRVSIASSPGARLGQLMLDAGAGAVRIDARVGRSANSFFRIEDHARLLAADRAWGPTLVIVMLGTNDIGLNMQIDGERMARIRDAFPGASVVGIGPPAFPGNGRLTAGAVGVVAMMRSVFLTFVDARPLTSDAGRAGDGVHFKASGAEHLAAGLFGALSAVASATPEKPSGDRSAGGSGGAGGAGGIVLTMVLAGLAWIIGRRLAMTILPPTKVRVKQRT